MLAAVLLVRERLSIYPPFAPPSGHVLVPGQLQQSPGLGGGIGGGGGMAPSPGASSAGLGIRVMPNGLGPYVRRTERARG